MKRNKGWGGKQGKVKRRLERKNGNTASVNKGGTLGGREEKNLGKERIYHTHRGYSMKWKWQVLDEYQIFVTESTSKYHK